MQYVAHEHLSMRRLSTAGNWSLINLMKSASRESFAHNVDFLPVLLSRLQAGNTLHPIIIFSVRRFQRSKMSSIIGTNMNESADAFAQWTVIFCEKRRRRRSKILITNIATAFGFIKRKSDSSFSGKRPNVRAFLFRILCFAFCHLASLETHAIILQWNDLVSFFAFISFSYVNGICRT